MGIQIDVSQELTIWWQTNDGFFRVWAKIDQLMTNPQWIFLCLLNWPIDDKPTMDFFFVCQVTRKLEFSSSHCWEC
jgi:hypothetical protein